MRKTIIFMLLSLFVMTASAQRTLENKAVWNDSNGKMINAHGGGIMKYKGRYWWYGENRSDGSFATEVGVQCYSSKNLVDWKNEGVALSVSFDDKSLIRQGCIMERPKVVYCKKTGKFVMLFHHELRGKGYDAAMTGFAVADKPAGPFRYIGSKRPVAGKWAMGMDVAKAEALRSFDDSELKSWTPEWHQKIEEGLICARDYEGGQMSRDMTLYIDDDGKAYHIYSSEENLTLHIAELTDDFLDYSGKYIRVAPAGHNEAPTIFKHEGKYWMITSGCTGWAPNKARLFSAPSILGPWTQHDNPCRGPEADVTFRGQSTFALETFNGKLIFMADVWNDRHLNDSRYIWLPIEFQDGMPIIEWNKIINFAGVK